MITKKLKTMYAQLIRYEKKGRTKATLNKKFEKFWKMDFLTAGKKYAVGVGNFVNLSVKDIISSLINKLVWTSRTLYASSHCLHIYFFLSPSLSLSSSLFLSLYLSLSLSV